MALKFIDFKNSILDSSFKDDEYMNLLVHSLYKLLISIPVSLNIRFNKDSNEFDFQVSKYNLVIPIQRDKISPYDYSEIVRVWAYRFFPFYKISGKNGKQVDRNFKVEKVIIAKDQLNVRLGRKRYRYISRIPVLEFLSIFKKKKKDLERKEFANKFLRKLFPINKNKKIEIKNYTRDQLMSFAKIRLFTVNGLLFTRIGKLVCLWSNFIINFNSEDEIEEFSKIVMSDSNKHLNIENVNDYIIKNFNVRISVKTYNSENNESNKIESEEELTN